MRPASELAFGPRNFENHPHYRRVFSRRSHSFVSVPLEILHETRQSTSSLARRSADLSLIAGIFLPLSQILSDVTVNSCASWSLPVEDFILSVPSSTDCQGLVDRKSVV